MKALALLLACVGLVGIHGHPVGHHGSDKEHAKAIGGMANAIANMFDHVEGMGPGMMAGNTEVEHDKKEGEENEKNPFDNMFAEMKEHGMGPGMMGGMMAGMGDMMEEMEDMMKGFGPVMSDMMEDMPDMMKGMPGFDDIEQNLGKEEPDFSKESTESKKVNGDTVITHKKETKHTDDNGGVSYVSEVDKDLGDGHSYSVVKVYENNNLEDLFGPNAVPQPTPMPDVAEDSETAATDTEEAEQGTEDEDEELDPDLYGPDAIPSPTPPPELPPDEHELRDMEEIQPAEEKPNEEEELEKALFFEPADEVQKNIVL